MNGLDSALISCCEAHLSELRSRILGYLFDCLGTELTGLWGKL